MKKIFSFILLLFCFMLVGCFENEYVENENGVYLTLNKDYAKYLAYDAPSFTFGEGKTLNTLVLANPEKYAYYTSFSHNDDLELSSILEELFKKYEDRSFTIVDEVKNGKNTHLNRYIDEEYVKENVNIDDSVRYYETKYILLENGLMLCVTYCRFMVNGKTIYRFRETKNIEIALMYPLMVVNENEESKFIIVPLPFLVSSKISGNSTKNAEAIINNTDYIAKSEEDVSYYVYDYPEIEDKKEHCMNFYKDYFKVNIVNDKGDLSYLGYDFRLAFYDNYFTIRISE